MFKKIFKLILNKYNLLALYQLHKGGPLHEDGWFRSVKENKVVDNYGKPIPWINYPTIKFLENKIHTNFNVFEYGSGSSTLWWSKKVNLVVSCEHNLQWYKQISKNLPKNIKYIFIDLNNNNKYENYIKEYNNHFDIIVIDGRRRVNCAINSLIALKKDGIIIWDNSDRIEYKTGIDYLLNKGFKKIEFIGIAPIINDNTETSIFYKSKNILGI